MKTENRSEMTEPSTEGGAVWEVAGIRVLPKIEGCVESRSHPYDNGASVD